MLSALSWIPRGAAIAKFPAGVEDDDKMDVMAVAPKAMESAEPIQNDDEGEAGDDEDEDEEVDVGQILARELDTLSFHKRGEKDPYLASDPRANEIFDEEELEDLTIKPTDALIVTVKSGEDASTMEVHLFDDDPDESDDEAGPYVPHTYVHHDLVLPSLPLCTAYTHLSIEDEPLNLVAVGMFTPGIDIWDIDRVNNLEPVVSLGGYGVNEHLKGAFEAADEVRTGGKSRRKKKKPRLRLREGSHEDAVMCLSWNHVQREYLASGSADTAVKIWDIESAHCACTLSHHKGKVQSVAFHPSKESVLLTGSFDRTVHIADVRNHSQTTAWSVAADIETCQWGYGPTAEMILASTEDGDISVFDPRKTEKHQPVSRWSAHTGPASGCSVSSDIPGLMVTGGVDKMLRVWDISSVAGGNPGELIYEKKSRAGALFSLSLCPLPIGHTNASPFVVAFGGAKGSLGIADLAVESDAVRQRFIGKCPQAAAETVQKRAARGVRASGSKLRQQGGKPRLTEGSEDDSDSYEDGESVSSGSGSAHED